MKPKVDLIEVCIVNIVVSVVCNFTGLTSDHTFVNVTVSRSLSLTHSLALPGQHQSAIISSQVSHSELHVRPHVSVCEAFDVGQDDAS